MNADCMLLTTYALCYSTLQLFLGLTMCLSEKIFPGPGGLVVQEFLYPLNEQQIPKKPLEKCPWRTLSEDDSDCSIIVNLVNDLNFEDESVNS